MRNIRKNGKIGGRKHWDIRWPVIRLRGKGNTVHLGHLWTFQSDGLFVSQSLFCSVKYSHSKRSNTRSWCFLLVCFVSSDILANVLSSWIHHEHTILQTEWFRIAWSFSALVNNQAHRLDNYNSNKNKGSIARLNWDNKEGGCRLVSSDILANVLSSWIHHGHTILQTEWFRIAWSFSALVLLKVSGHIQQFNITSDDILPNKENLLIRLESVFEKKQWLNP
jgi:hypothetical protein